MAELTAPRRPTRRRRLRLLRARRPGDLLRAERQGRVLRDQRRRRQLRLRRRPDRDRCDADSLRETVRERYAAAALATTDPTAAAGCCGTDAAVITDEQAELFGAGLYADGERDELPDTALLASLGCGNPTAMADLHEGETVLDLGSGGGIDVLLSARRVGPTGTAYGLDMTDEMLDARARATRPRPASRTSTGSRATSRTSRCPPRPSTSCSPTASSTSPPTSRGSCARPRACSSPAGASPSRT